MMAVPNTRPSGSLLGKNSTVQSQSSSSCQYGSTSCCWFIRSVWSNPHLPKFCSRDSRCEQLSQCGIPAAPHYGLRYGSVPATGNFQRLRGRPPLVSPLKSCMGRSFTAVTRVQIPSGTPNLFRNLRAIAELFVGTKRHKLERIPTGIALQSSMFSDASSTSSQAQKGAAATPCTISRRPHLMRATTV